MQAAATSFHAPPMRVGGISIAFEVAPAARSCSQGIAKLTDVGPGAGLLRRIGARLKRNQALHDFDKLAVMELAESLMCGRIELALRNAHRYMNNPLKLAYYRDILGHTLASMNIQGVELLPTKVFRVTIGGALTDIVTLVLKLSSSDLAIGIASHPAVPPQVLSVLEMPDGSGTLEPEPRNDVAQVFHALSSALQIL